MNKPFSPSSQAKLDTCHIDLQMLFTEVQKHYDCTIICGARSEAEQQAAFEAGNSKLEYPKSKHNSLPSMAVDVAPSPIDWQDTTRFYHFAGFVLGVAKGLGIDITWGGDWAGDLNFKNDKFKDLPHFELKTKA